MSDKKTRVRFAPSPTGPLHMGGVRTALYNYLYAKQNGGNFILRIEDTDSQRFVPGAEEYIIESLKWCGIYPDEGVDKEGNIVKKATDKDPYAPYRQSERKPIYRKYAEELVNKGFAYYAFDSSEELNAKRAAAEANKSTFIYNYITRKELKNSLTLGMEEVNHLLNSTNNWTIRFKTPENRIVKMEDLIRGHIEINTNTIDDKVLWKAADELPTYHLANIVDDHLMEITEVIRGEEWLPSLPLHYLLYEAFGWQETQPRFAHLSLLLKPDGKGKLSKRDGDRLGFPVFPLKWINQEGEISRGYREDGYYPEAFINMLALLGWNPGTEQELFTLDELVKSFSLERVVKSGAKFNPEKAKWFNEQYLRKKNNEELAKEYLKYIEIENKNGSLNISTDEITNKLFNCTSTDNTPNNEIELKDKNTILYFTSLCALIKERAHFVKDFWEISHYFFVAPTEYNDKDVKKFCVPEVEPAMKCVAGVLQNLKFNSLADLISAGLTGDTLNSTSKDNLERIENALTGFIQEQGWKMGAIMNTLRLFFVGEAKGLGIADIIFYIGKTETIARINKGIEKLF